MSHDHYYHSEDLGKFGEIGEVRSDLAEKFFAWYGAVFEEGALSAREKSLIALAVAHAVQCFDQPVLALNTSTHLESGGDTNRQ